MSGSNNSSGRPAVLLEACVESLEEALAAEGRGAHRLELCARLDLGGITPADTLVRNVLQGVNIPVKVMVRPRGGDFLYSDEEFLEMERSVSRLLKMGVHGLVLGITGIHGFLDLERIARLSALAVPVPVCVHKAIDAAPDPVAEVKRLCTIPGLTSVLSSGGATTALEGAGVLKRMVEAAGQLLVIIAAGRITPENLDAVVKASGVAECHGRKIV
ncbi:MAG: copper homeostasis protein CutC [Bacteroidales bacterium]|nr:copper homeostasis protein CutC [Bacteroidales bacterium]